MDPLSIALICAASFGALVAIAAFIRIMFLSRDKRLNDEAQTKALMQETADLQALRLQMQSNLRFEAHYQVLGNNKEAITSIDQQIESILQKKMQLVDRFAQVSLKEAEAIVNRELSIANKEACDKLKQEIDTELRFYDQELAQWQERRKKLWDTRTDFQQKLLDQEKSRNKHLDALFHQHSALLEKVYLRHIDERDSITKNTIEAGSTAFKWLAWGPMQFLLEYFNISTGIALSRAQMEYAHRRGVAGLEIEINSQVHHHSADKNPKDQSHKEKSTETKHDSEYKPCKDKVEHSSSPTA